MKGEKLWVVVPKYRNSDSEPFTLLWALWWLRLASSRLALPENGVESAADNVWSLLMSFAFSVKRKCSFSPKLVIGRKVQDFQK